MDEQPCVSLRSDFTNRQSTPKIEKVSHNEEVCTFSPCKRLHFELCTINYDSVAFTRYLTHCLTFHIINSSLAFCTLQTFNPDRHNGFTDFIQRMESLILGLRVL